MCVFNEVTTPSAVSAKVPVQAQLTEHLALTCVTLAQKHSSIFSETIPALGTILSALALCPPFSSAKWMEDSSYFAMPYLL